MADAIAQTYPFTLTDLEYDYDALEPVIDTETMHIHHDKHHQAYVNNLNAAVEPHTSIHDKTLGELLSSIDSLPEAARTGIKNNGGGHYNHSLFWQTMGSEHQTEPDGQLGEVIKRDYGSFSEFCAKFDKAGAGQFGSGWAVVTVEGDALKITPWANQDTPLNKGVEPLFLNDVWEHAYYLKYNNRRPDYLKAWWEVVNWKAIAERYERLKS